MDGKYQTYEDGPLTKDNYEDAVASGKEVMIRDGNYECSGEY